MKKKNRTRNVIIIIVLAVVVIANIVLWRSGSGTAVSYAEESVKSQDISTYFSFSGHIRASEDKQQTAKKNMKVRDLLVAEGDHVDAGDILFRATDGERVYADISGIIEVLHIEKDSTLGAGSPIAEIVDYSTLKVIVDADEYDVGALSVGQSVSVFVNALGITADGIIDKIANDAIVGKDVSFYSVEISVANDGAMRAGMSVETQVMNGHVAGATTISMDSLQFDAENMPFVYIRDGGGNITPQYVSIGINDGTKVQLLSGPQPGDTVYRPARTGIMMPFRAMRG